MPLDGHSYLVAQGWSGRGSGLRNGAISRPLAIPQKKTLAGLGKDRDEAFPFWDHIFSVAAKTIKVKIHKDDEDDNDSTNANADPCPTPALPALSRTITGILSNKRPTTGTPASSGSCTPTTDASSSSDTRARVSLVAAAKRDAARRGLYSRFFRGPVLGPYDDLPAEVDITEKVKVKATVGETLDRNDTDDQLADGDARTAVAGENLKRSRKEKRKMEKEEKERRKAEKIMDKTNEKKRAKKVDKASAEERQGKRKRKDKGKGKEEEPTECGEINAERKRKRKQLEEVDVEEKLFRRRKRKEERERELEDTSRAESTCDTDRTRKKKKRSSDSGAIDALETAKNKSKAERKDRSENRKRGKEEKREKRREKEAEVSCEVRLRC